MSFYTVTSSTLRDKIINIRGEQSFSSWSRGYLAAAEALAKSLATKFAEIDSEFDTELFLRDCGVGGLLEAREV